MSKRFLALSAARLCSVVTVLALITGSAMTARAELIYGVTDTLNPSLVTFDSATPSILTTIGTLSGITPGQILRAIDFRASNGLLYALSSGNNVSGISNAQLYTLSLTTAVLTTVGSGLTLTGNDTQRISLDFNPVADVLRVVTLSGQNYRVNADTGTLIAQDTDISSPGIADIAYTNNVAGASSTTLYGYDFENDILGTIGSLGGTPSSPNTGIFTSIGSSGQVAQSGALGFDVSGATGIAYVSLDNDFVASHDLYTVDLASGALTFRGNFNTTILDISVSPAAITPPSAAPEPSSLILLLPVLGAVSLVRRKK